MPVLRNSQPMLSWRQNHNIPRRPGMIPPLVPGSWFYTDLNSFIFHFSSRCIAKAPSTQEAEAEGSLEPSEMPAGLSTTPSQSPSGYSKVTIQRGKRTNSSKESWCQNPYCTGELTGDHCLSTLAIYKDHQRNLELIVPLHPGQVNDTTLRPDVGMKMQGTPTRVIFKDSIPCQIFECGDPLGTGEATDSWF